MSSFNWDWIYPDFRFGCLSLMEAMERAGHPVFPTRGYSTYAEQNELYQKGRSTAGSIVTYAKGGESFHNFGLAVDFAFVGSSPWSELQPWALLGKVAKDHEMEWGGDFKIIVDRPHVQDRYGFTLAELREFYAKGGLVAVWSAIDALRGVPVGEDWYHSDDQGKLN